VHVVGRHVHQLTAFARLVASQILARHSIESVTVVTVNP
jgi:hypothetical protein